jgi:predicted AlkP superfamily pyrophosphatase or phosphodiesterase
MRLPLRALAGFFLGLMVPVISFASAYNARPKLVVIFVIDQFRGDYLERYRDQFGDGGFKLFLDHGANFTDCYYNYANTQTAAGHATLLTGAYSNGHGILANQWWDPRQKRMVTSVEDDATRLVGAPGDSKGASPHNLLADTLGDELKLATQGKAKVFAISLKDRSAVLPAGFAGNAAYWIEPKSGAWVTSTYYRSELPKWAQDFNDGKRAEKYRNLEWKDSRGNPLRATSPAPGKPADFFTLVGSTPFANDYEFDFARELITYEKLGSGPATDLLIVGLSANDILGHQVGPDSAENEAMALALDRQIAGFAEFLGHQIGLANVWMVLSADHGIPPLPAVAAKLRIPAGGLSSGDLQARLNQALSAKLSPAHAAKYVQDFSYTMAWLNEDAFAAVKMKEDEAEHAVGEALKAMGLRGYFTRSQLARGEVPNTALGLRFANSYSPQGGWYVMTVTPPYFIGEQGGTNHGSPYPYDTHVPLAFYGLPFQAGTYRTSVEPVDLAPTLASLLGINRPTHAIGRVLTEALLNVRRGEGAASPQPERNPSPPLSGVKPVAFPLQEGLR